MDAKIMSRAEMPATISHCARCGQDHGPIRFRAFLRPILGYEFWALCPETGEPLLMTVTLNTAGASEATQKPQSSVPGSYGHQERESVRALGEHVLKRVEEVCSTQERAVQGYVEVEIPVARALVRAARQAEIYRDALEYIRDNFGDTNDPAEVIDVVVRALKTGEAA